jgi:four helix bundle protein
MEEKKKIESFKDLIAWKESYKLALMIYKITKNFPKEEVFALTSQIRRSATSIPSNIAEGFSRFSAKDKGHFYTIALGSLTETQNHLLISKGINYLDQQSLDEIWNQTVIVSKLCNGLIKIMRSQTLNT